MVYQRDGKPKLAAGAAFCLFALALVPPAISQEDAATKQSTQTSQEQSQNSTASPIEREVTEAWRLYEIGKTPEAEKSFQEILQKSAGKDAINEGEAHLGLGSVATRRASFAAARAECEKAIVNFNSAHDARRVARAQEQLGNIALLVGDTKTARGYYNEVIKTYDAQALLRDKSIALLYLAMATDGYPERIKMDTQVLEIASQLGDRKTQGRAHHDLGQWIFIQGDYQAAELHYKAAEGLLDTPEDKLYLARVLLSEGRLHRAHGEMDRAIEILNRALKLAEEGGDQQGQFQIMNALGASYGDSGRYREALQVFQHAYDLAKDTGSARITNGLLKNIAEAYIDLGEYQKGAEIVEALNRQTPDPFPYDAQYRYATLAAAYDGMEKYDAALGAVTKSVEEAKARKNGQFLSEPLMLRARIEKKMGNREAALTDTREALKNIEELRAHLVPSDFMKRGFGEKTQVAFDYSVDLLQGMNQPAQAIEVAEEARSRAFLDLLASHQLALQQHEGQRPVVVEKPAPSPEAETKTNAKAGSEAGPAEQLTLRAGNPPAKTNAATSAEPELSSAASAGSASLKEMQEQASRLHSTILSYWSGDDSTFVWVMDPEGSVHSATIPLKREALADLVRTVWPFKVNAEAAPKRGVSETNSHGENPNRGKEVEFSARGQEGLKAGSGQKDQWRELYRVLIEPVEAYLPKQGSRITIIPHGPLFALPFSGLRDASGHYFLERYTLEYAPAISVLRFTGALSARERNVAPHFLLVADPAGMQKLGLPQLPGSLKEVSDVAHRLPSDEVTVLTGAQAQEETVRSAVAKSTVVHFATHGIVDDAQPFDSFLALSDGKLTARDIYGLNLDAELVFLSACRSGMGKVTGDGVLGLTRAFLYAGTRSVVATLWDVADEPTAKLVAGFYENMSNGEDKAQALRDAQLSVLKQLRAGKIQVTTRRGKLTLPENPIFWASFVLIGEP